MKTFLLLLSACVCAFAQSDIAVLSITNTFPESRLTLTMDFFTRNGQTNLIRTINTGAKGAGYADGQLSGDAAREDWYRKLRILMKP